MVIAGKRTRMPSAVTGAKMPPIDPRVNIKAAALIALAALHLAKFPWIVCSTPAAQAETSLSG